jgi:hypothetical protein
MKNLFDRFLRRNQEPESQSATESNVDPDLIRIESTYKGRQAARAQYPNVDRSGDRIRREASEVPKEGEELSPQLEQVFVQGYVFGYLDEIQYLDRGDEMHIFATDAEQQGRQRAREIYPQNDPIDRTGSIVASLARHTWNTTHPRTPAFQRDTFANAFVYGYLDEVQRLDNWAIKKGGEPHP